MTKCVLCVLLILSMSYNECFSNFTEEQKKDTQNLKVFNSVMRKISNSNKKDELTQTARNWIIARKQQDEIKDRIIEDSLNKIFAKIYLYSIDIPFDNLREVLCWNEVVVGKTTLEEINNLYGVTFYRKDNGYSEYILELGNITNEVCIDFIRFVFDKHNVLKGIYGLFVSKFFDLNYALKENLKARQIYCNGIDKVSVYTVGDIPILTCNLTDDKTFVFWGDNAFFEITKKRYQFNNIKRSKKYKISYTENLDSVFIEMAMKEYGITRMQAGELLYSNNLSYKDKKRRTNIISKVQSRLERR